MLTWHHTGHFGAPIAEELVLPQALLRKYITYAKMNCKPKLMHADMDKISRVYAQLRKESAVRAFSLLIARFAFVSARACSHIAACAADARGHAGCGAPYREHDPHVGGACGDAPARPGDGR